MIEKEGSFVEIIDDGRHGGIVRKVIHPVDPRTHETPKRGTPIPISMIEAMGATIPEFFLLCLICISNEGDFNKTWLAKFQSPKAPFSKAAFIAFLLEALEDLGATDCQIGENYYRIDLVATTAEQNTLFNFQPQLIALKAQHQKVGSIRIEVEEMVEEAVEAAMDPHDRPTPVAGGKVTRGDRKDVTRDVDVKKLSIAIGETPVRIPLHGALQSFAPHLLQVLDPEGNRLRELISKQKLHQ